MAAGPALCFHAAPGDSYARRRQVNSGQMRARRVFAGAAGGRERTVPGMERPPKLVPFPWFRENVLVHQRRGQWSCAVPCAFQAPDWISAPDDAALSGRLCTALKGTVPRGEGARVKRASASSHLLNQAPTCELCGRDCCSSSSKGRP